MGAYTLKFMTEFISLTGYYTEVLRETQRYTEIEKVESYFMFQKKFGTRFSTLVIPDLFQDLWQ